MRRNRGWWTTATIGALLAASVSTGRAVDEAKPAGGPAPRVKSVTLLIRHRVWERFAEQSIVPLQKEFPIGDKGYTARVDRFIPDFAMGLKTRKIFSRSNEPRNPGFRIIVRENGAPRDTVWAFVNMPPHFARKSLLAFQVTRIDFENREPIVAPADSAAPGGNAQ